MNPENIKIKEIKGVSFAEINSPDFLISTVQDAVDLLGNCYYTGIKNIILKKEHFSPDFYDLKSGLAGDILQKFSNYNISLTIIGDFKNIESKGLKDFIYESNKTGNINFVESIKALSQLITK